MNLWENATREELDAYERGYRVGVEAALTICTEAYYDTDSEKDPDILMRERTGQLLQHKEGE